MSSTPPPPLLPMPMPQQPQAHLHLQQLKLVEEVVGVQQQQPQPPALPPPAHNAGANGISMAPTPPHIIAVAIGNNVGAATRQQSLGGGGGGTPSNASDTESVVAALKSASRRMSEGFVAFNKGFEECDVTPEPTNPVKKDTTTKNGKVNLSPTTPLKSIAGAGVQILKIDDLRMFCSRNGIKGSRKAKKADICWAICKAKERYLAGDVAPYKDLIPVTVGGMDNAGEDGEDAVGHDGGGAASYLPMDVDAASWTQHPGGDDDVTSGDRKRRRLEDANEVVDILSPPSAAPTPATLGGRNGTQPSEHVLLQRRIVQSKEDTNAAIRLRELIESAATLRREIREEKDRRVNLWKEFVAAVGGDESMATSRVTSYSNGNVGAIQQKNNDDGEHPSASGGSIGEGEVKGSYETLIENVIEQDALLRQVTKQHAALNTVIDGLILPPKEEDGKDGGANNDDEVSVSAVV